MANFVENEHSMNRFGFRLTTLIIVVLLAGMAALQAVSLKNMYDERMHDFERKVVSAMQRSAYEELTIRRNNIMFGQTLQLNRDSLSAFINEAVDSAMLKLNELSELSKLYDLSELGDMSDIDITILGGGAVGTVTGNVEVQIDTVAGTPTKRTKTTRTQPTQPIRQTENGRTSMTIFNGSNMINCMPQINIESDIEMSQLDFEVLSSCLRYNLAAAGITQNYRMTVDDDTDQSGDDLADGLKYSIPINVKRNHQSEYIVEIDNPNQAFIKDMRWLIISAAVIVLLIAAICFYLQYALFRQKSLARIKADFTHNITHELKTPIAVAYAANDALSNFDAGDDPQKRKRYLSIVGNQLSLLSAMVERILTMSIEERDDFRLSVSECDAAEMLSGLREQFLLKADKPTTITVGVMPQPLRFRADRLHLSNIIGNLIDNAVKYSGDSVDINLSASLDDNRVAIVVEDNGIGIPQSSIGHIFEKFYRVPTGELHDVKGFGLGLYYVKLIVGKHGGTISVRSRIGKGTAFTIKLPYDGR